MAVACPIATLGLASTVDRVQDAVQSAVEAQAIEVIASATANQVEAQVADRVNDTALRQVEESVTSRVTDAASVQVEESVTSGVADQIVDQTTESVVSGAGSAIEVRIETVVGDSTIGRIVEQTPPGVGVRVDQALKSAVPPGVELPPQASNAAMNPGRRASAAAGGPGEQQTPVVFHEGVDPEGRLIERDVLVLLVPHSDMDAVRALGMNMQRQRVLPGLGLTLVRLQLDPGLSVSQAAALVRQASAGTTVDYNHLYELNAMQGHDLHTAVRDTSDATASHAGLTLGVIDTAIEAEHPALAGAHIFQRNFIGAERSLPTGHGTAIASILVEESRRLSGVAPALYAANVFFERAPGVDTATTESIVAALGWMIEEDVAVVNMSLTGPANELLQLAVERAAASGSHVVAAVGNNGPLGEPLYPAAYESVIGVTAVDGSQQAFVYANRGRHVMFSAPGVGVRVADSSGGYAHQDGTSLAAAHAAVIIATSLTQLAQAGLEPLSLVDRLKYGARDLGPSGYDETFGYGLITPLDI